MNLAVRTFSIFDADGGLPVEENTCDLCGGLDVQITALPGRSDEGLGCAYPSTLVNGPLEIADTFLTTGVVVLVARDTQADCPINEGLCDRVGPCLLYTSDAADDLLCVDLGGR